MRSYAMSSNYPETAIVHKDPEQPERSVASRSTINSLKGVENGGHGRHYSRTSSGFLQRFSNEGAPDPDLTSYRTIPNEDDDFGFRSRFSSTQVSKNQLLFWISFPSSEKFELSKPKSIENCQKHGNKKVFNLVFQTVFILSLEDHVGQSQQSQQELKHLQWSKKVALFLNKTLCVISPIWSLI